MTTKQLSLDGVSKPKFMFNPNLKTESARIEAQAKFIVERHRIFLKKQAGLPKPWTKDPVLRTSKFTNVYREIDPVSVWIWENVIKPNEKNPNLPVLVGLARLINWPDTIRYLMECDVWPEKKFKHEKFYRALSKYKEDGYKVVTGAYIVNTVYPKGFDVRDPSKVGYISDVAAVDLWKNREMLYEAGRKGGTVAGFVEALQSLHGWGAFMSYQVVVDLTYSKLWLKTASDYNTFTSPGPGTTKGMNWILTGNLNAEIRGDKLNEPMQRIRPLVNECVRSLVKKSEWTGDFFTGFAEISMSNYSNCCCETSKMVRSIMDGGTERMKNKYNGG